MNTEFFNYLSEAMVGWAFAPVLLQSGGQGDGPPIPEYWHAVANLEGPQAISCFERYWNSGAGELPMLLGHIRSALRGVYPAEIRGPESTEPELALLYCLDDNAMGKPFRARIGYLPRAAADTKFVQSFPPLLQKLYVNLHDGFTDEISRGNAGIHRVGSFCTPGEFDDVGSDWEFYSDDDDEFLLSEAEWPDLNQLVEICSDGARNRVCVDISNGEGWGWKWAGSELTRSRTGLWRYIDDCIRFL